MISTLAKPWQIQVTERQGRKNPTEPTLWIMDDGKPGDLNNGLAVALALSPHKTRIITSLKGGDEPDTVKITSRDPQDASKTQTETVARPDFPDVFINSTGGFHHGTILNKYSRSPMPVFSDMITVHIRPPDSPPVFANTMLPETEMNVLCAHQAADPAYKDTANLYVYDMIPSRVNAQTLAEGKKAWGKQLEHIVQNGPVYLVVLGNVSDKDAEAIATQVTQTIGKTGGSLLLTTSSRTRGGKKIIEAFTRKTEGVGIPSYVYDYNGNQGEQNPYMGMLALADKIVVSKDSMSMLSDAVAAEKPVFTYTDQKTSTSDSYHPQDDFANLLLQKGIIHSMQQLETNPAPVTGLNPAEEIAAEIRRKLKLRQNAKPANVLSGILLGQNTAGKASGFLSQ